jgi:hypothetical protein
MIYFGDCHRNKIEFAFLHPYHPFIIAFTIHLTAGQPDFAGGVMSMTGRTLGNFKYTVLIGRGSTGKIYLLPKNERIQGG